MMVKGKDYIGNTVVFFCHDGEGNYVLNKRSKNCRDEQGLWDCGGGGIEVHDNVVDTLKKEIKEEYCADVLDLEFLGYRDVHRGEGDERTHWISLDFKVRVNRAQVGNGEPHKFEEIGWFPIDAFPKELHSQLPIALELHKEKL